MGGNAYNLNFETFFRQRKESSLDEIDVDVDHRKGVGRFPFADIYGLEPMVLQNYKALRLHLEGHHWHQDLVAVELQAWKYCVTLKMKGYMRYLLLFQNHYIQLLPEIAFALGFEKDLDI